MGCPTVEVECLLSDGTLGRASVPSGASTGDNEAVELRDQDSTRLDGKGVLKAVANVQEEISPRLKGMSAVEQVKIDNLMIELDGTENKGRLGANAILGVSMAVCRAAALSQHVPLYRYIGGVDAELPLPFSMLLTGGNMQTPG